MIFGLAFIWIGKDYGLGTARRMGPGNFPLILAALLTILGLALTIRSFKLKGEPIEGFTLKGLVLVLASTLVFGLLIRQGGMVPAVVALILISAFASVKFRVRTAVIMAAVVSVFCVAVFSWALGLPISAFGVWFGR